MAVVLVDAHTALAAAEIVFERNRPPPEHRGRDAGSTLSQMAERIVEVAKLATNTPEFISSRIGLDLQEYLLIKDEMKP
jgi:hypothetical protein